MGSVNKEDGIIVGWCGLKYDPEFDETDIGFRFFEHYWNKGYASESALATIQYGFESLGLETIVGRVMRPNVYSIRVLEKIGMKYVGEIDFGKCASGLKYEIHNWQFIKN